MKKLISTLLFAFMTVCAASAQDFTANLRRHVEYLSSTELMGRKAGSKGEAKAAAYLYDQLEKAGLTMLTSREGDNFLIIEDGDTLSSCNIAGIPKVS